MTEEFKNYADQLKNEKLFETEELYQNRLDEYIPIFQNHFKNICETVIKLQKNDAAGEISYLEYTLLFTNLIRAEQTAEIRIYDDNWYFDPRQRTVGSFDFSFLFVKYRELWTELMSSRKRFARVTAQDTQVTAASNGMPAAVYIDDQDFAEKSPGIFRIRSSKGAIFLIIHLSVAESILRRGICGLELVRLTDE